MPAFRSHRPTLRPIELRTRTAVAKRRRLKTGSTWPEKPFDPQSDWRNIVILEVSAGRIVSAEWTAAPRTGGPDKLTHSINGDYGMERVAEWPWHKQANAISGATIGIRIMWM